MKNENLEELTRWLTESAKAGGQFVEEQTPLYINEFLRWAFISNCMLAILCLIIVILYIYCVVKFLPRIMKEISDTDELMLSVITVLISIFALFAAISLINSTTNCIKIKTAPRLVIMEHIMEKFK